MESATLGRGQNEVQSSAVVEKLQWNGVDCCSQVRMEWCQLPTIGEGFRMECSLLGVIRMEWN